jgi:hypothetical protein
MPGGGGGGVTVPFFLQERNRKNSTAINRIGLKDFTGMVWCFCKLFIAIIDLFIPSDGGGKTVLHKKIFKSGGFMCTIIQTRPLIYTFTFFHFPFLK